MPAPATDKRPLHERHAAEYRRGYRFVVLGSRSLTYTATLKEAQAAAKGADVVRIDAYGAMHIVACDVTRNPRCGGCHGKRNPLPARTADTMSEAIALSSPSGRMSKRARDAANARLSLALFGPGGLQRAEPKQRSARERHLEQAARLRDLAARGMSVRKFTREAERLEALAAAAVENPRKAKAAPKRKRSR